MQLPNPLSPLEGDEIFFAYMISGASFQARDGSQWDILGYPWQGYIHIGNRWYPRLHGRVTIANSLSPVESVGLTAPRDVIRAQKRSCAQVAPKFLPSPNARAAPQPWRSDPKIRA